MIDWFSGVIQADASNIRPGHIVCIDPEGNVLYQKEMWSEVEGSFSNQMRCRRRVIADETQGIWIPQGNGKPDLFTPNLLQVSGNPSKYLQSHNVFGPPVAELEPVLHSVVLEIGKHIPIVYPSLGPQVSISKSRVDIAVGIDLGSRDAVGIFLESLGHGSRTRSQRGAAIMDGKTVYWQQHSRRWSMKAYDKYHELLGHPVHDRNLGEALAIYSRTMVRLELCLRGEELKAVYEKYPIVTEEVLWDYWSKIQIGGMDMERIKNLEGLPLNLRRTVLLWKDHPNVRDYMCRNTYYTHRRRILELSSIDISVPPCDQVAVLEKVKYDKKYLMEHVLKDVPVALQPYLFKPSLAFAFSES